MSDVRCQYCLGYVKKGEDCPNCGMPSTRQNLPQGVKFRIGVPEKGGTRVQSIMFDRQYWTPTQAKQWLTEHGYAATLDIPETGKFFHARQERPSTFKRIRVMGNPQRQRTVADLLRLADEAYQSEYVQQLIQDMREEGFDDPLDVADDVLDHLDDFATFHKLTDKEYRIVTDDLVESIVAGLT